MGAEISEPRVLLVFAACSVASWLSKAMKDEPCLKKDAIAAINGVPLWNMGAQGPPLPPSASE